MTERRTAPKPRKRLTNTDDQVRAMLKPGTRLMFPDQLRLALKERSGDPLAASDVVSIVDVWARLRPHLPEEL